MTIDEFIERLKKVSKEVGGDTIVLLDVEELTIPLEIEFILGLGRRNSEDKVVLLRTRIASGTSQFFKDLFMKKDDISIQ